MPESTPARRHQPLLAYSDAELVARAVRGATSKTERRVVAHCVADTFCVGSGVARELCRRFDVDPDEIIGPDAADEEDGVE